MEWNYWREEDLVSRMPPGRESFAVGAQNRLAAMEGTVVLFDPGEEVVPGVEAMDTAGHTPGHVSFAIHAGGESVVVIGDALAHPAASFRKPDWPYGPDQDPDRAIASRLKLLDRLSAERSLIVGFHLPDGGVGRVERDGAAYRFVQGA